LGVVALAIVCPPPPFDGLSHSRRRTKLAERS